MCQDRLIWRLAGLRAPSVKEAAIADVSLVLCSKKAVARATVRLADVLSFQLRRPTRSRHIPATSPRLVRGSPARITCGGGETWHNAPFTRLNPTSPNFAFSFTLPVAQHGSLHTVFESAAGINGSEEDNHCVCRDCRDHRPRRFVPCRRC